MRKKYIYLESELFFAFHFFSIFSFHCFVAIGKFMNMVIACTLSYLS